MVEKCQRCEQFDHASFAGVCLKCGRNICSRCRSRLCASTDLGCYGYRPLCKSCDTQQVREILKLVRKINQRAERERSRLTADWAFRKAERN